LRLGGTIPLLEKDKANPLEFTHSRGYLPGKHSPTVARASDERPGFPIARRVRVVLRVGIPEIRQ